MKLKKAVVVQCRLGSTRLKNKALKEIDEKTILEYVLNSMKNVDASLYYVLTDFASVSKLKPIVEKCGWNLFAGSEFDVLDRFCSFLRFIENTEVHNFPDIIVRATADNPFLFYDCASKMIETYKGCPRSRISEKDKESAEIKVSMGLRVPVERKGACPL